MEMTMRVSLLITVLMLTASCADQQPEPQRVGTQWKPVGGRFRPANQLPPPSDVTAQPDGSIIFGGREYRRSP
jgi:hypothetical protein